MQSAESHLEFTFKMRCIHIIHSDLSHNKSQRFSDADRLYMKF